MRMKAARLFETLGKNDPTSRRGDPEDLLAQYSRGDALNRRLHIVRNIFISDYTGLFVSPSGTSELDCATIKTDTTERSISIGRESLKVFFVLGALAYLQVPLLGGSRDEK